jgi:hypothetical protein
MITIKNIKKRFWYSSFNRLTLPDGYTDDTELLPSMLINNTNGDIFFFLVDFPNDEILKFIKNLDKQLSLRFIDTCVGKIKYYKWWSECDHCDKIESFRNNVNVSEEDISEDYEGLISMRDDDNERNFDKLSTILNVLQEHLETL